MTQRQAVIELAPARQIAELLRYMRDWIEAGHPTGEHLQIARLREQVLQMHRDLDLQQRNHAEALAQATGASLLDTELVREAAAAGERVAALQASASWRITAPLRTGST